MLVMNIRRPHNDPIEEFEGSVIDTGLALHGLASLMITTDSYVTSTQVSALIESIALRLDAAFDRYEAEQAKIDKQLKMDAMKMA